MPTDSPLKPVEQPTKERKSYHKGSKTRASNVTEAKIKRVKAAVRAGTPLYEIAESLGISMPSLRKYYNRYIFEAKLDIPALASDCVYEYLLEDFSWMDNESAKKRAKIERAKIAIAVLRSLGWREDGTKVAKELNIPRVMSTILPDSDEKMG